MIQVYTVILSSITHLSTLSISSRAMLSKVKTHRGPSYAQHLPELTGQPLIPVVPFLYNPRRSSQPENDQIPGLSHPHGSSPAKPYTQRRRPVEVTTSTRHGPVTAHPPPPRTRRPHQGLPAFPSSGGTIHCRHSGRTWRTCA